MTDTLHTDSATTSIHSDMIVYDFDAIETMNEFYAANGWDADFRQIEPGPLQVQLLALDLGHLTLIRERVNRKLESNATTIENAYSLILALSDEHFHISGRVVGRDSLLLVRPNTKLHILARAGVDALTVHIPADRIGDYGAAFGDADSLADIAHMTLQSTPAMSVDAFREMVLSIFTDRGAVKTHGNMHWSLMAALTDLLTTLKSSGNGHDPYGRLGKHSILIRARSYVHEHLSDEILMKDLCDYVGVSLSTLERVFRRELDVSPKRYILATRLHEARRRLWDEEAEPLTIAEIAHNCGFTHMGRFSRQYQDHFGHLPSEVLQRGVHFNGDDRLP